jgi:hypothetical protein
MLCVGGTVPVSSFSFRSVLGLLDKEAGIYAVAFDFPGTDTPGLTSQHFMLRHFVASPSACALAQDWV